MLARIANPLVQLLISRDMVNAVDAADVDQVIGKSMCVKMLIKTVGRRDIS